MNTVILLLIELIICLLMMLILYKYYKMFGLYTYIIAAFIISNIMSLKIIPLQEFDINLGIVPLTTIFIATNIIVQKQGTEENKKISLSIVITAIISFIVIYLTSLLNSSNINLFTNKSFDNIFDGSARIYFANIATILYTILLNGKLYLYLKSVKNKIWISNIFSSIIIQFLVAILFNVIAYAFVKEPVEILEFIVIRYLISLISSIIGTTNVYIGSKIKEK